MARKQTKRKAPRPKRATRLLLLISVFGIGILIAGGFGVYHSVNATTEYAVYTEPIDPNIGLRALVEDFFTANDAPEMIPIIRCESQFKHFNTDGSVLKNEEGSSAIGIAQILTSKHPDPKVLKSYNRTHNADVTADDLDLTTVEGNLGYALMLYEVRGTRDWECAERFRFN